MAASIGILIPTLHEASWLTGCLDSLGDSEVPLLVADGGSTDGTVQLAAAHPIRPHVLVVHGGRHLQLNVGLNLISAEWILVLPADARLLPGAAQRIAQYCATISGAAACLNLVPDDRSWQHRVRASWSRMRSRLTGGAYLDQVPIFRRKSAVAAGGFRACGAYVSADLGWRLRRSGRFAIIPEPVLVSCRDYRRLGFWRVTLAHQGQRFRQMLRTSCARSLSALEGGA